MSDVFFYHLTRSSVESTLQNLLPRARQAGWRVAVRARDAERLDWLDQKLWLGPDEEFLPHGVDTAPHAEKQPILLTTGKPVNEAHCLMSVDGADVEPSELDGLQRACILFDGRDDAALAHARDQWRSLTSAGCAAVYWSEESGRWEKKAESKAA